VRASPERRWGRCPVGPPGAHGETASGKSYNNLYRCLFEVRNGKIQAVREYFDTMHAKEVLVDQ
jgi:hypothetical protein